MHKANSSSVTDDGSPILSHCEPDSYKPSTTHPSMDILDVSLHTSWSHDSFIGLELQWMFASSAGTAMAVKRTTPGVRRSMVCSNHSQFLIAYGPTSLLTSSRSSPSRRAVDISWSLQIVLGKASSQTVALSGLNAVVEAYIRHFTTYAQDNWYSLLPMVALHIAARPANATGLSPFLLTHGWEVNALELFGDSSGTIIAPGRNSPVAQGERIVNRLRQVLEWAQASMAAAQEDYERHANAHRTPAPAYKPGDKVWLSLHNIHTDRPSKKLDAQQAQFTVLEQVGSHAYRLDTPPGVHNVFHTWLLHPASSDPFPSQRQSDYQPPPIIGEQGDEEWEVECILAECIRRGKTQYKVKWRGYLRPTWEP
ncbi:hypothetical protein VTO42DRAFT_5283 [Malbranchea cinnamomea]